MKLTRREAIKLSAAALIGAMTGIKPPPHGISGLRKGQIMTRCKDGAKMRIEAVGPRLRVWFRT